MEIAFLVDGIHLVIEVEPEMILREVVEKALIQAKVRYSPEDMIVVCNNELLNQSKSLDKQTYKSLFGSDTGVKVITGGLTVAIMHKSKRMGLIPRRNPYDGSIRGAF